jgi:hypothetical protein
MIIEGLAGLIRMLVMDNPSLALYLFPMVVSFTSLLMFFDELDWMKVGVVGKHWLFVFYIGQWMNEIYLNIMVRDC